MSDISFGPFRLLAARQQLLEGDKPVRLGGRALDILIALTERPGELVAKATLMSRVWPDTVVEETNLSVNIAGLRRALGDGQAGNRYIVNIPGRGYRFVAPVAVSDEPKSLAPRLTEASAHNLPARLMRLIGRADFVTTVIRLLPLHRLLTIVGPGGVGKTSVALEAAEQLIPAYEHGVWLVDLAPIDEPRLVPTALASALGLEIRSDNPLPGLIAALSDKHMLLVLDNCEHLIDAAASLAGGVLAGARGVHILSTSREPLRVQGERVRRLSPLETPPASVELSAAEALSFPAVQLFLERAAASMNEFELSEADAAIVGDICRALDGIPLAIELAAARVEAFGVGGLAKRLDGRFQLLTGGRRGALPRHRTISAALDWSYQLLTAEEQRVFRRLAIFAGGLTLKAARAVASDTEPNSADIADTIASLVAKSLVAADIGDVDARFRLLETVREDALAKLRASGEAEALARRHAGYYRDLLEEARNNLSVANLAAAFASELDNIRAALTWAFGSSGDASIGVALAADSAPIWLQMSLLTQCRDLTERALVLLDVADRGTHKEMALHTAAALALMMTRGMSSPVRAALMRANELAESLENVDYQLRTLALLANLNLRLEEWRSSLVFARRLESVAEAAADPIATATANCILSSVLAGLADLPGAVNHARLASALSSPAVRRAQIVRFGFDLSVQARKAMAMVLWGQGLLDQSAQTIQEIMRDMRAETHTVTTGYALTWCLFVVSLGRDFKAAEGWIAQLKYLSAKYDLTSYKACCLGIEGLSYYSRGDLQSAEPLLRASVDGLRSAQYKILYTPILSGLAETLADAGRIDDGLAAADEALQRSERNSSLWWIPEALRIKGRILLLSNRADQSVAEGHLRRSLELAHGQGALSWELRTAMSIGQLRNAQGRVDEARLELNAVYSRFTEGFDTPDLRRAKRLLEEWK